jgi:hypothetical protein
LKKVWQTIFENVYKKSENFDDDCAALQGVVTMHDLNGSKRSRPTELHKNKQTNDLQE